MNKENDFPEENTQNPRIQYEKRLSVMDGKVLELQLWRSEHRAECKSDVETLTKHDNTLYDQERGLVSKSVMMTTTIRNFKWVFGIINFIITLYLVFDKITPVKTIIEKVGP